MKCQGCGGEYDETWYTKDKIWFKVVRNLIGYTIKELRSILLCIKCFDNIARENGIRLYWECEIGAFPTD